MSRNTRILLAVLAEGDGADGPIRQLSGVYEGRSGRTFFTIVGPIAT